jgi:hypothetical protein
VDIQTVKAVVTVAGGIFVIHSKHHIDLAKFKTADAFLHDVSPVIPGYKKIPINHWGRVMYFIVLLTIMLQKNNSCAHIIVFII